MWTHKKHKQKFKGTYERNPVNNERVFILTGQKTKRRITFESWQMAKKLKWSK